MGVTQSIVTSIWEGSTPHTRGVRMARIPEVESLRVQGNDSLAALLTKRRTRWRT